MSTILQTQYLSLYMSWQSNFLWLRNCFLFSLTYWLTHPAKLLMTAFRTITICIMTSWQYDFPDYIIVFMISFSKIMTSWQHDFHRLHNCFLLTDWLTHPVKAADDLINYYKWRYTHGQCDFQDYVIVFHSLTG